MASENPFYRQYITHPLIVICGQRGGYIQLAANAADQTRVANVPSSVLIAALAWAQQLEALCALRVYWFCLSEEQPHLHWHLYPRWHPEETLGWALFSQREKDVSSWTAQLRLALNDWATIHNVYIA